MALDKAPVYTGNRTVTGVTRAGGTIESGETLAASAQLIQRHGQLIGAPTRRT